MYLSCSGNADTLTKGISVESTESHNTSKSAADGPRKTVSASHTQSFMKFGDKSANRQSGTCRSTYYMKAFAGCLHEV